MFSPILLSLHSRDMWNGLGAEDIELRDHPPISSPPPVLRSSVWLGRQRDRLDSLLGPEKVPQTKVLAVWRRKSNFYFFFNAGSRDEVGME